MFIISLETKPTKPTGRLDCSGMQECMKPTGANVPISITVPSSKDFIKGNTIYVDCRMCIGHASNPLCRYGCGRYISIPFEMVTTNPLRKEEKMVRNKDSNMVNAISNKIPKKNERARTIT